MDTIDEILACLRAWEPSARVLGNITAGNAIEAIERLRAELEECKAELEFFRTVLYSGWTVYEELRRDPKHGARTSPDNVGDTLDAIARLRKAALAAKESEK